MDLFSIIRATALTCLSIVLVLCGAYYAGGVAARRAAELKRSQEAAKRAESTLEVVNRATQTTRSQNDESVVDELSSDWMRR